jgi:hypothetical protein
VSNPLLIFWSQLFGGRRESGSHARPRAQIESSSQASSTIFLIMRRMRTPLNTLIVIFFVSVVGLTLIPGVDPEGRPARLSLFESFYFMSYTATTIASVSSPGRSPLRSDSGSPSPSTCRWSAGRTRSAPC